MGRSADVPRAASDASADDAGCTILHVDMDAFFASVEIRRRPELRSKPVIVGGGVRGVVAAASYAARRYGVRSAMPIGQALRLCPQAVVIAPDREAYTAASQQVMAILRDVTPHVEPLSLDEAFLDISGVRRLNGPPRETAEGIRRSVFDALGLTCSVGVATSKFVAKLASARCKPNGLLVVPADGVLQFLHPLPVTVLWGVGARTAEPLHRLGIRSVADLAATPLDTLRRAVGVSTAQHLHDLSWGRDSRAVTEREPERSISSDRTYDTDLTRADQVHTELLRLSADVSARVRSRGLVARTVGIKIRFADFTTITRVRTLPTWVDTTDAIHAEVADLYDHLALDRPRIRLVGVKCENLREAASTSQQLSFDLDPVPADSGRPLAASAPDARARARAKSELVADAARARFGDSALSRASLLRAPETNRQRPK
ncbi:DNA polymerase-4 [Jatrophihabitans sp. GAS493]|uniref:DNA polymerase IV n=1 Tax=Jatrophihabitans sp. GAS493 TaxID=1907575 RepID=UPI000BB71221|nr:DNA polymerase IV [Jatrophihabitans sp. GAS493]SOD74340.1 DNA polymerase-4 [Jatrophihabitans sp. GAS493]